MPTIIVQSPSLIHSLTNFSLPGNVQIGTQLEYSIGGIKKGNKKTLLKGKTQNWANLSI